MRIKNKLRFVAFAAILAPGALAHHSFGAFDFQHPAMLTGTIKSFVWANPHTQIALIVPTGKGGDEEWDLAGGSVNSLVRQGYTKTTLAVGMKVQLMIAPRHDGKPGGEFMKVLGVENGGKFVAPAGLH